MNIRMDDGTVVNTEKATKSWSEERDFDGSNRIGRYSGSQWNHATLYRSRKGRYYMVMESQWSGVKTRAEWLTKMKAVAFLLVNDIEIPEDLKSTVDSVEE